VLERGDIFFAYRPRVGTVAAGSVEDIQRFCEILRPHPEQETEATAEIFNDLQMEKSVHPIAPLLSGQWE